MNNKINTSALLTLSNLHGTGVAYTSRPSYDSNPWLSNEEHQSNYLTGREILIADQLPMLVHQASVTEKLTSLFELVGLEIPENIFTFDDKYSYECLIQQLAYEDGNKILFQYPHSEDVLSNRHYGVDKDLFIALNNKSRLAEWTNNKYLPDREVINIEHFSSAMSRWSFPFVLKIGDDLPTSGGNGVMICHNNNDLKSAKMKISNAQNVSKTIIIERKIEAIINYSVQYAYSKSQGLIFLGATEQLTDTAGHYQGNHKIEHVPRAVVQAGKEIMQTAVDKGYLGVAGFDLLVDKNENIYAIDLNFRQNASTSLLMLEPMLKSGHHKFFTYISPCDNKLFFNTILKYVQKGILFPIAYYDGDWYSDDDIKSRFCGIWHGGSKDYLEKAEIQFLKEIDASLINN